jgi:hypothetical protein
MNSRTSLFRAEPLAVILTIFGDDLMTAVSQDWARDPMNAATSSPTVALRT